MMLSIRDVGNAASVVREQFDNGGYNPAWIGELYRDAYGVEGGRYIKELLQQFPNGNCTFATLALRHMLQEGDVVDGRYGLEPHTFLAVDTRERKDVVTDVTADQFDGPCIYVGKLIVPWSWPLSLVDVEVG